MLTRVCVFDLAETRRYEAQLATEKRLAEEAYEAVRVQQVWERVCVGAIVRKEGESGSGKEGRLRKGGGNK